MNSVPCATSCGTITYMLKIRGVFEGRHVPVQVLHPSVDIGVIVANRAEVALEMTMVYRIKSHLYQKQDIGTRV
jgi:hypothetical protein